MRIMESKYKSWTFGEKIRSAGLLPSFGSVGDGLDNAMRESLWSSMRIELLDRKKWKTRVELANAIFHYMEMLHNRQRRHSAFGYRTPFEYETLSKNIILAASWRPLLEPETWGRSSSLACPRCYRKTSYGSDEQHQRGRAEHGHGHGQPARLELVEAVVIFSVFLEDLWLRIAFSPTDRGACNDARGG